MCARARSDDYFVEMMESAWMIEEKPGKADEGTVNVLEVRAVLLRPACCLLLLLLLLLLRAADAAAAAAAAAAGRTWRRCDVWRAVS